MVNMGFFRVAGVNRDYRGGMWGYIGMYKVEGSHEGCSKGPCKEGGHWEYNWPFGR